ncbi:MAG: hypothetical protein RMM06_02360 [Armatimonadota bacterium]|nr:hypothetical protein [Armatimonadota bacterium]
MPFTVSDFEDLLRLLQERPEWRERLRALILPEEILTLPQLVRENTEAIRELRQTVAELVEAQRRTDERLEQYREESREETRQLRQAIAELAEAQRRTDERLEQYREETREEIRQLRQALAELAEAQRRTDERVAELAEAQRRTDERLEQYREETREEFRRVWEAQHRLEQRVEEYQAENRQRFSKLEAKVDALASEVGRLSNIIGASLEEEAQASVATLMRQQGYIVPQDGYPLRLDGAEEIDVVLPVESPQGDKLTVVAESKARLSQRAVVDWANRMKSTGFRRRLREAGVSGPYLVYMYAIRVDPAAIEAARRAGIGVMCGRGVLVEPSGPIPDA